jgi:uncharacterized membrane protein YgaE (UPF0421/DUF939 family)
MPRRTRGGRVVRAITSPYYRYRHAKLLHSVRVGLAMIVSILATTGINIPHGIWASVTLLVVIGGLQHHGNIRKKAADRAAGTLLGATIGLVLILQQNLFGALWLTYVLMSIVAGICAWYAIGKAGYIGLLTAITMCIVAGHGDNLIDTGLWRTLNVLIGIVIALAFSFALPLHATYSWRYLLADNLRGCARIYARLVDGALFDADEQIKTFLELNARLVQLRALMPSVAKEIEVPPGKLEEIQRVHRAVLSALEIMASGICAAMRCRGARGAGHAAGDGARLALRRCGAVPRAQGGAGGCPGRCACAAPGPRTAGAVLAGRAVDRAGGPLAGAFARDGIELEYRAARGTGAFRGLAAPGRAPRLPRSFPHGGGNGCAQLA